MSALSAKKEKTINEEYYANLVQRLSGGMFVTNLTIAKILSIFENLFLIFLIFLR